MHRRFFNKKISFRNVVNKFILGAWIILATTYAHAGIPVWTFTPLTATQLSVTSNDTATVQYLVTNQSKKPHELVMKPIPGITQVTTAGNCPNPFILGYQQSCILNLSINGALIDTPILGGPVVCDHNNPNQCYQPNRPYLLNITRMTAENFTVGGSIFGLSGTLVLVNNGSDAITLSADGRFTFSSALPSGTTYSITIQSQPATQTCTVTNGSGTITNANITNITVNCSTNTVTLGGTVSGLATSESVVLQNNGGDNLIINNNGSFVFTTPVVTGTNYQVSVLTQPSTQTCTVNNGIGTAGSTDITNVQVICATNAYTVGGTLSGLSGGTVVLQNNGIDNLSLTNNGLFTFPLPIAEGAAYSVTILTQPVGQTCVVTNGSGIMGGTNVTNVFVTCTINTATLTQSLSDLALSVTGLTEYGVPGTPSSGLARTVTITNTGIFPAVNLAVNPPTWPSGTLSSTTCGSTLGAGSSCTITVTPGNTATSNGTSPCSNGTSPVPGVIQVTADNANTVSINVVILSYSCIYQGGYVFAFDDTTPSAGSVGGTVATTTDQAPPYPNGVVWSSNGVGSGSANVAYDAIYGISENSTPIAPDPSAGQVAGQTACAGFSDGACNTNNIYVYYQNNAVNAPINPSFYAAGLCKQTIAGFSDWYLPAICQVAFASLGLGPCGTSATPTLQNIASNLVLFNNNNLISGNYWSSTEYSATPLTNAWNELLGANNQGHFNKSQPLGVRCARALTF